jgi:hypothetical protein
VFNTDAEELDVRKEKPIFIEEGELSIFAQDKKPI